MEKNCTDEWFYFLCGVLTLWINYVKMCGEQGFIAVRETVHLVKFIGVGWSIFFSSAYVTLLMDIKY